MLDQRYSPGAASILPVGWFRAPYWYSCRNVPPVLQATGGAFSCVVIVPANSFKFTRGAPRYHFTQSAAVGQHKRGFCADCGSRLTGGENPEGTTEIVGINAGSLDDPSWFCPQMDIF